MPGNATPYPYRIRRWVEQLTLTQYALFTGVQFLLMTAAVMAVAWWSVPHSWLPHPPLPFALFYLPVLTVLMTAWHTWQRRKALRRTKNDTARPGR